MQARRIFLLLLVANAAAFHAPGPSLGLISRHASAKRSIAGPSMKLWVTISPTTGLKDDPPTQILRATSASRRKPQSRNPPIRVLPTYLGHAHLPVFSASHSAPRITGTARSTGPKLDIKTPQLPCLPKLPSLPASFKGAALAFLLAVSLTAGFPQVCHRVACPSTPISLFSGLSCTDPHAQGHSKIIILWADRPLFPGC